MFNQGARAARTAVSNHLHVRLGPDQLNNAAGITDTESGGHSDAGQRSASETPLELSFRDTQNLC